MVPDDASRRRFLSHQAALFALQQGAHAGDAASSCQAMARAAAATLGLEHASLWLLDPDGSCMRLASAPRDAAEAAMVLAPARQPALFSALRGARTLVAPHAASDPRTCELHRDHLAARGSGSALVAGVWRSGALRGALLLEARAAGRAWLPDEQLFAASVADLAATTLDDVALERAVARLEESQELFAVALRSSPDWISVVRLADGQILHVNEAFERESGYRVEEVIGQSTVSVGIWLDPGDRAEWVRRLRAERLVRDFEVQFRRKGGEVRTFLLSGHCVTIHGEECAVTISRDVTDVRRTERLMREAAQGVEAEVGESFFRSLVGELGRLLEADLAFVGEFAETGARCVRTIAASRGGEPVPDFEYALAGSPCETVVQRGICAYPDHVAQLFPRDEALAQKGIEAYVGAPLSDSRGRPLGLMAVLFKQPLANPQIAQTLLRIFAARAGAELERRQHFNAIHHLAHHDPLTGLPNRVHLLRRIEEDLPRIEGSAGGAALLLIDLDRFKEVNDTLGHVVGDHLLERVAERLSREIRAIHRGAEVARLGGDEFAIWIDALSSPAEAERLAAFAHAAVVAPLETDGLRIELGASIGIALAPRHAHTEGGLMRCADVAMYVAKDGFERYVMYDPAFDPYTHERLQLLGELADAVRHRQIVVHFQPRVRLADGSLASFEALARWQHPRLGLLPPARFIPLAELSEVIRPLTVLVLDEALAQQARWGKSVGVSVNLTARHLVDESCPEQIARALAVHGCDPRSLEIEITESALINDPDRARGVLERIGALGVRAAIDDFGTGYSSLSHLKRLPLNALKIDSSFIGPMMTSAADNAIVQSTVALAHNLGLEVVAEGVEDEPTYAALREAQCEQAQGYHIARPMPAAEAARWMAQRRLVASPA